MGEAGIDVHAVMSNDLLGGIDLLRSGAEKSGMRLLCSNQYDADGRPLFEGHAILEFEGKRLGVIAVVEPDEQNTANRIDPSYRYSDPKQALMKDLAELRGHCDAIVLLYGGWRETALERCADIEGIDLILAGLASRSERIPLTTNTGAPVYSAATRGKDLGEIRLTFKDDGTVQLSPFTVHELKIDMKEDPYIASRVGEFLAALALRNESATRIRAAVKDISEVPARENFLGTKSCTPCHRKIVDDYLDGPHAESYQKLFDLFEESNLECIGCHVTGWRMPGGFGQVTASARSDLDRVQCEACHGYGSAHVRDGTMRDSARRSCAKCHNADVPEICGAEERAFDFHEAWKKIAH